MQKKAFLHPYFILLLILMIIIIILGVSNIKLSIFDDKAYLRTEYITYWADATDSNIQTYTVGSIIPGENDKFKYGAYVSVETASFGIPVIGIGPPTGASDSYLEAKHNFYGQEVVLLVANTGGTTSFGGNTISVPQLVQGNIHLSLIILRPNTLDNSKVDVYMDSAIPITTITVANPTYLKFYVGANRGLWVGFIGYKTPYWCNLASDERWIQESFANSFTINDLSFRPTKFCKDVRPFTLRNLQQGEEAITPNPIPAFNRGEALIPLPNSIITVNYATPNVAGIELLCNSGDSAYKKINGVWVCKQVIKPAVITKEILAREIIKVQDTNSFIYFADATKTGFNVGSSHMEVKLNYNCNNPTIDEGSFTFPNPSVDCYTATITYEGKSVTLKDKEFTSLNNNIAVQYFAGGGLKTKSDGGVISNLQGSFVFSISDALNIDLEGGLILKYNQPSSLKIKITNNLPLNNIIFKITQIVKTTNEIIPQEKIINIPTGTTIQEFPINTNNLGINEFQVQAFYSIDADSKVLLASDKIRINTEILANSQQSIVSFIGKEQSLPQQQNKVKLFIIKIWQYIKNLFI